MIEISIVIPVYNSADCLRELFKQIKRDVSLKHEVIFVNDQSTDGSWAVISALAKENKDVIGINLRRNCGQDNALMAGLSKARGNYIVIMDDDLQHAPKDIENLYEKCRQGFDVCYANFVHKKQKPWKNIGSRLNEKMAELMLKKPRGIYLSPFKIIKKDVVEGLIHYRGPYPYLDGLILMVTNNVTQVNVEHHERFAGKSNYTFVKSLAVGLKHMTGFSVMPLRLATIGGLLSSMIGFLMGIFYIFRFMTAEYKVEGWTTLVVLNLFIGGMVLFSLGLIGEYVGRSYLSLNSKPTYHIKDTVGG